MYQATTSNCEDKVTSIQGSCLRLLAGRRDDIDTWEPTEERWLLIIFHSRAALLKID